MNAKKLAIALSLLFAGSASVFATTPIPVNPGPGDPQITVGSLGWNNGFAITTGNVGLGLPPPLNNPVGTVITTFGHGNLANFNNAGGTPIGGLNLNSTYQWTYVFGLTETVVSHTGTVPTDNITLDTGVCAGGSPAACVDAGVNFFQLFEGPIVADPLQGTGYATGTLILSGTFLPFGTAPSGVGTSTFTASGVQPAIDNFGANNYPNIATVTGAGSINELANITFANPTFFPTAPKLISVTANGFTNLPFSEIDPSSCYFNGATLTSALGPNVPGPGACAVNTVGAVNGNTIGFSNVAFETRVTSAFNATAPEPGSLALLGLGLTALVSFARRHRQT